MKNPWARKNPFLSMWLSGANAAFGAARGRAAAESKRQASTMMTRTTKQMMDLWTVPLASPPPRKKRSKKR